MKKRYLLTVIIGLIVNSIYSQTSFKEIIKDYDDICFCNVGLSHPKSILNLDNNMEILFTLREGKTLNELDKTGVKYSKSQISLLKLSGLIAKEDSVYQTIIPILSKDNTLSLRRTTMKIANEMVPQFQDDFEHLLNILNTQGLQRNIYSLFFSFVIDGLVWDILEQENVIEETNITQEKPFWNGTFWLIEPKRELSCGTNILSSDKDSISIYVNWSNESKIDVSNYENLGELIVDYKEHGKITSPKIFKEFENDGLFNKNGELRIPVIKADNTNDIYSESKNIAGKIVDFLKTNIDYSIILSDYTGLTKGQKITILYHEIMWDILDIMEESGQLKKPIAFAKPNEARSEDLRDLIFIVKN